MRKVAVSLASFTSLASLALLGPLGLAGCTGDDNTVPLGEDAGGDATVSSSDGGTDAPSPPVDSSTTDSAAPLDAPNDSPSDAADASDQYLLLSYEFPNSQQVDEVELGAFDTTQKKEVGYLQYAAGFAGGTNMSTSLAPWVLEENSDIVMRMDPAQPWIPTSSWSVASTPQDGGYSYSDPYSVAETGAAAYVALYNRDHVAVLDTTKTADGGAPSSTIDLSSLQQAADPDGSVEDTAAFYDPSTKLVWLVLGNIDEYTITAPNYELMCVPGLTSTVVAIDTTTGALSAGHTYTLTGYDPVSAVFDAANERLLISSAGCTEPPDAADDAGGSIEGRLIEQIDLGTGTSTVLFNATSQGFPGALIYVDVHDAFVSFGGATNAWDPTTKTLGTAITNAPDTYAWDGKGLLGPATTTTTDGGVAISVVEVSATNVVTTIGSNPVSSPNANGFWLGADVWPHP
jgi:hypothetical protein